MPAKTMAQSVAVREAVARRRRAEPMVSNVQPDEMVTLSPKELAEVRIDERYQRSRITIECNRIITALKLGGRIPAPISVAERPDKSRWVLDGQQRYWAALDCEVSIQALIYRVDGSLDTERTLFGILNSHVQMNSDTVVKAWPGVSAEIIRLWATRVGSPYLGKVAFGAGSHGAPYHAAYLARGLVCVSTGMVPPGSIQRTLERADFALAHDKLAPERCDAYMRLVTLIFPTGSSMLPLVALGRVAYRVWEHGITGRFPTPEQIHGIQYINFGALAVGHSVRNLPQYEAAIQQVWSN